MAAATSHPFDATAADRAELVAEDRRERLIALAIARRVLLGALSDATDECEAREEDVIGACDRLTEAQRREACIQELLVRNVLETEALDPLTVQRAIVASEGLDA